jgi:hypothetical protein
VLDGTGVLDCGTGVFANGSCRCRGTGAFADGTGVIVGLGVGTDNMN